MNLEEETGTVGNYAFLDVKKSLESMDLPLEENTLHRKLMLFVSPAEAEYF